MLTEQPSQQEYTRFVETLLAIVDPKGPPPIHAEVAAMIMLLDLTPMRKIILNLYSAFGRPVRVPEKMLRHCFCGSFRSAWINLRVSHH
jgi:hypothetical protein